LAGIKAGTTFENLPRNYSCQVCETPKDDFETIKIAEALE
jgi:rubredoxin